MTSRTLRRLLEAFGAASLRIELQRPFLCDDRTRNRRLAALARAAGRADAWRPATCTRMPEAAAPLQDAFVAIRLHSTLDASEPQRRGNFSHVMASPAAMAARFAEHPEAVAESARLAARLRFDLCSDLGYRYPGAEDRGCDGASSPDCAAPTARRAMPTRAARRARAGRGPSAGGAADHREAAGSPASSCSITTCSSSPVRSPPRCAGRRRPGSPRALLPPGRGRGSSVSSIVCYLTGLSHVDPIANELMIGRFLNEELTSLPDIDLDFPRDIRAALIPRVHERYGRDRSALVAAFPTYRARGAIRELGKALGLPAGEIERLARGSEGWDSRRVGEDIENTFGVSLESERPQGGQLAGAGAGCARRRGPRAATTPLPALGRDDRLDTAVDRLLPDRARGDGGAPDRPVGQGLLLGRGVSEDRSARPRDALGGRAVRRVDRTDTLRADRPQPDPLRRSRHLRMHPERRHDGGLSDREPSADAVAATHPAGEPEGHHHPGGDRPTGTDPGRRGQSVHRTPSTAACRPRLQDPVPHPSLESVRSARRSGRSSSRTRCWRSRSPSPGSRSARRRACAAR